MADLEKRPAPDPRVLWLIWGAFLAAPLVYLLVAWLTTSGQESRPVEMVLVAVLAMAAVGTIVAGYVAPRFVQARLLEQPGDQPQAGAYQNAMIVQWACFEAVAIYGFVLTFLAMDTLYVLVGAVVAVAFLASARPQSARVR